MKEFRLKLVMVNQPRWSTLRERIDEYKTVWYRAKNAPKLIVEFDYLRLDTVPVVDGRASRAWFDEAFSKKAKDEGFHAIGLILRTADVKKWGFNTNIRGSYFRDIDGILEFTCNCDERQVHKYKNGMKVNQFLRILAHEMMHGVTHFTGYPDFTHKWDYDNQDIFAAYAQIDWHILTLWQRVLALKQQLFKFLNE